MTDEALRRSRTRGANATSSDTTGDLRIDLRDALAILIVIERRAEEHFQAAPCAQPDERRSRHQESSWPSSPAPSRHRTHCHTNTPNARWSRWPIAPGSSVAARDGSENRHPEHAAFPHWRGRPRRTGN
jgi:hypothetical protein